MRRGEGLIDITMSRDMISSDASDHQLTLVFKSLSDSYCDNLLALE